MKLPTDKVPLLLVFHGGGGSARGIEAQLNINQLADKQVFVVCLNDTGGILRKRANRLTWNAGNCYGWAVRRKINQALNSIRANILLIIARKAMFDCLTKTD